MGFRVGPNKVSMGGFMQPIADAAKLANKRVNQLLNQSFIFYYLSSGLIFFSSLVLWNLIYFTSDYKLSFIIVMLFLGVNSFNSIICGWSTFSKYSLLGSLRTVAQLISYEAALYLCLFFFFLCLFRFNFGFYSESYFTFRLIYLPVCLYIWVPSVLAELNRTPYDFSEGERELVRGFNTEFGSSSFTLIFLAEYRNIIFFSFVTCILFLRHGLGYIIFFLFFFFVIWIRSVLPRYRFDLLMSLAWKFFIPFLTLVFVAFFLSSF